MAGEWFQTLFNFQRILRKKEYEKVCVLIWTNFDSFANTYLYRLLQKFHFPIEVVLNSLSLELVSRLQFFMNFLIKFFLL